MKITIELDSLTPATQPKRLGSFEEEYELALLYVQREIIRPLREAMRGEDDEFLQLLHGVNKLRYEQEVKP